jgi:hypothetical protein
MYCCQYGNSSSIIYEARLMVCIGPCRRLAAERGGKLGFAGSICSSHQMLVDYVKPSTVDGQVSLLAATTGGTSALVLLHSLFAVLCSIRQYQSIELPKTQPV